MIICQLAGFLGSGKTTLLVRLGTELGKSGKKVAIIVNEVGEIGVDGAVIDSFGLKTVELTEGCICCSLSGSLQNTLREISSKYGPDVIIIEPTGIALASKINEFVRRAMVSEEAMYTICLIDAYRAIQLFSEAELFLSRQIAGADLVAVNKVDIVDDATKARVTDIVTRVAPNARIAYVSAKTGEGIQPLIDLLGGKK